MGTMLDALNQAFDKENDEIDYPSIEEAELDKIRRKWNDLRDYSEYTLGLILKFYEDWHH